MGDQRGGAYLEVSYLRDRRGVLSEGAYVARFDADGRVVRAAPLQMWYPQLSTRWRAPFMAGDVWTVAPDGRVARVDADFPRHVPPFVETYVGHVAMIAPDGALWVMRYAPPRHVPVADVFDDAGRRTLEVELPRGRRLAGFGESSLFLLHTDEDGLQWLERHPWSR